MRERKRSFSPSLCRDKERRIGRTPFIPFHRSQIVTVLQALENRLQPQYIGWQDQYKAILTALGIPLYMEIGDLNALLDLWKEGEA